MGQVLHFPTPLAALHGTQVPLDSPVRQANIPNSPRPGDLAHLKMPYPSSATPERDRSRIRRRPDPSATARQRRHRERMREARLRDLELHVPQALNAQLSLLAAYFNRPRKTVALSLISKHLPTLLAQIDSLLIAVQPFHSRLSEYGRNHIIFRALTDPPQRIHDSVFTAQEYFSLIARAAPMFEKLAVLGIDHAKIDGALRARKQALLPAPVRAPLRA